MEHQTTQRLGLAVGIGLIVAVAAPGLVEPGVAIAGFANKAVVTVAALFVVGEVRPDRVALREALADLAKDWEGRGIELVEVERELPLAADLEELVVGEPGVPSLSRARHLLDAGAVAQAPPQRLGRPHCAVGPIQVGAIQVVLFGVLLVASPA